MFRLTLSEWQYIRSQSVTASESTSMRSQIVTASQNRRNTNVTPYAFTEQGDAMLSGILNSDKAINMNIAIMRAFFEVRKVLLAQSDFKEQLKEIKERLGEHDAQLNQIYDAMENLKDYFKSEDQPHLKKLLTTGTNLSEPLIFKGNGNQLADAFKQLFSVF